jgi:hypothetical protein
LGVDADFVLAVTPKFGNEYPTRLAVDYHKPFIGKPFWSYEIISS